jgi:NAD(P)-dependent dehydrogenase (short-subunit alcohol dehydrogenase family)
VNARPQPALPRKVLLTGASGGIGAAIARALSAEGVRLALVGRDRGALSAVAASCGAAGAAHALLVADLSADRDGDGAPALADRAAAELCGLDGFVACAGVVEYASVGTISAQSLARQMTVNFSAQFLIAQRAAHHIAQQGGGAMLLIASTLGLAPAPLTAAYAASKAALISAARSLALELGPRAIRVNALALGVVDTDMVRVVRPAPAGAAADPGMPPDGDMPRGEHVVEDESALAAQLEALRRLHPLGRLGRPEDVAESALYLLRTPYVSGTVMLLDGGLSLASERS